MRLLYVADARSPIARNWIEAVVNAGHDVHLIATNGDVHAPMKGVRDYPVPLVFATLRRTPVRHLAQPGGGRASRGVAASLLSRVLRTGRYWVGPATLRFQRQRIREIVDAVQPDLIHAMRIPFEGMAAALSIPAALPLVVSVWGNDFTLHAPKNSLMSHATRRTMRRADALIADTQRDVRLAHAWGFDVRHPHAILPGAGGVCPRQFELARRNRFETRQRFGIAADAPVIVQPRGMRDYVRNDVFFAALPEVIAAVPDVRVLCVAMADSAVAHSLVTKYALHRHVTLLPHLPRQDMADVLAASDIAVSPAEHDGTPNTLLESMAAGCYPVSGDIESVREWITHGENGLLFDTGNAQDLARTILHALQLSAGERARAIGRNHELVATRANHPVVMEQALAFYECVVSKRFTISNRCV